MQEKTLEEEFEEKFPEGSFCCITQNCQGNCNTIVRDILLYFISSREEKAREEGRNEKLKVSWLADALQAAREEGHLEGYKERQEEEKDFIKDNYEKWKEEGRKEGIDIGNRTKEIAINTIITDANTAVTQYKEELLKSLPEENSIYEIDRMMVNDNKYIAGKFTGFNECLSAVKKII
jgi:hypothetical protein